MLETALFFWLIRQTGAGATARRGLCACVVVLFSSLYQSENFQWAFQVQFVSIFACASLCCTLFALGLAADGDDRRSAGLIAAAYLLALVATFTMANGILVGLVLVAMAAVARARRAVVSLTVAVAVALILAFSVGYHLYGRHESAGSLWHHAARVLAFTAGYLGNFARFGIESQVAFGALGLIAMGGIAGLMLVRRDADPTRLALLGIAGFTVGSAFITALGRSDAGMENIASSRYSTGAATFWAAILITGWSLSRGAVGGIAARVAVCAAALFLLEAATQSQIPLGFAMQDRVAKYGAMEDAMLLGLLDRPALDDTQEPVGSVVAMVPVLRRLHLSIFRGRDAGLIDHPLSEIEATGLPPPGLFRPVRQRRGTPGLGSERGRGVGDLRPEAAVRAPWPRLHRRPGAQDRRLRANVVRRSGLARLCPGPAGRGPHRLCGLRRGPDLPAVLRLGRRTRSALSAERSRPQGPAGRRAASR